MRHKASSWPCETPHSPLAAKGLPGQCLNSPSAQTDSIGLLRAHLPHSAAQRGMQPCYLDAYTTYLCRINKITLTFLMISSAIAAFIGLMGSLVAAAVTYWFTKQREREAEWRKEKLAYYKAFVESFSGIVEGDASPEGHRAFAKASNNLLLFAPQSVIASLNAFRHEIRISNSNRTIEQHDRLLADLLLEIRRDVGVFPQDNPATFSPVLWSSGMNKDAT